MDKSHLSHLVYISLMCESAFNSWNLHCCQSQTRTHEGGRGGSVHVFPTWFRWLTSARIPLQGQPSRTDTSPLQRRRRRRRSWASNPAQTFSFETQRRGKSCRGNPESQREPRGSSVEQLWRLSGLSCCFPSVTLMFRWRRPATSLNGMYRNYIH